MKISVIIPVYNVENYLSDCLESVINQTYENLEILLINDGSTDQSEKICIAYAEKDSRIRFINKSNSGVSNTRNYGILNSTGDYLSFIDADDWIELDFYQDAAKLIKANKYDVLIYGLTYNGVKNSQNIEYRELDKRECLEAILSGKINESDFVPGVCNKIFSKTLLQQSQLLLDENITVGEDMLYTLQQVIKSEKIVYTNAEKYHYRFVSESTMNSTFKQSDLTVFDAHEKMKQVLLNNGYLDPELDMLLKSRNVFVSVWAVLKMKDSFSENLQEVIFLRKIIISNIGWFLKDSNKSLIYKIYAIILAMSPRLLNILRNCYFKFKNMSF